MARKPTSRKPRETSVEKVEKAAAKIDKRVVAGVAGGIAVGSAALAAALLFAGRTSKPKSAALDPKPTPPAAPSGMPDASTIKIQ